MSDKPLHCITQETQDCSSEQMQKSFYINHIAQANIIDVWSHNFHQQMERISSLNKKFNVIAFDTQFPSIQEFQLNQKQPIHVHMQKKYLKLTKNVENTSLIQLGLCLSDDQGFVPSELFCWQFNFKFQDDIEKISPSSANLLKKAGINFQKFKTNGISYKTFIHEFIKSGLLLNPTNKWITFHGAYDFSYLLKLIRNQPLPKSPQQFYKSIKIYFPQKFDLKCLIEKDKNLKRLGLSRLADFIKCRRTGPQHQAGSDSLLTLKCYFRLKYDYQTIFKQFSDVKNVIYDVIMNLSHKNCQTKKLSNNFNLDFYNYTLNQNYYQYGYYPYPKQVYFQDKNLTNYQIRGSTYYPFNHEHKKQ